MSKALLLSLLLLLDLSGTAHAESAGAATRLPATAQPTASRQEAKTILAGLYLRSLPELDIKTNSYLADFYLWFRWAPDSGLDPSRTFEFTNAVQSWDLMKRPLYTDEHGNMRAEQMPDGSLYQIFHVHGRFQNPFDLRDYPFDRQQIRIELEESESLTRELTYAWDNDGSLVHKDLVIPGWTVQNASVDTGAAAYGTNFGDMRNGGGEDLYSRFTFTLGVERPLMGYLVKTVLPITVVMLITFVVFFIELRYFEGRIGLAITGLISAVALQLTSGSELPNVGYMVLLDKIYNLSYFVIFIALAESVWAVKCLDAGAPEQARRLDRIGLAACAVIFFGGSVLVALIR